MRTDEPDSTGTLKAFLAAAVAAAIAIGLALSAPHKDHAPQKSHFVTLEVGHG